MWSELNLTCISDLERLENWCSRESVWMEDEALAASGPSCRLAAVVSKIGPAGLRCCCSSEDLSRSHTGRD